MKPLLFSLFFFCAFCNLCFGQKDLIQTTQIPEKSIQNLMSELEGTYQITISNPNQDMLFTKELLQSIKDDRQNDQSITKVLDQYTTLYIPSFQEINAANFQKLETLVRSN